MKLTIYFLLASLLTIACERSILIEPGPIEEHDINKIEKGFVKGKVVDSQNKPIANAKIVANSLDYEDAIISYSDNKGNYRIKLPTGIASGSFYVRGSVKMKFNGQEYFLALFTENDGQFSPYDGAIKNLRLKITGKRTGNFGDDGFYGGTLEMHHDFDTIEKENIELTLIPDGTLVDGSTGQTLVRRFAADDYRIYDIPIGKYKITAKDVSNGKKLKVKIRYDEKDYSESTTGVFLPPYELAEHYEMTLLVK
ncbi:carboxypeptidase-like regulatory domain-containing protein [Emticicia soli]|uniref:Carboxypeptidase-like regulatory domain-containing protein n=1 Tax=Emticicia soli TaxID=2027878 RepID=A0ABW5J2Z9_9BACT